MGISRAVKQGAACASAAADCAPAEAVVSAKAFECNEAAQMREGADLLRLADQEGSSQGIGQLRHPQHITPCSVNDSLSSDVQLSANSNGADQTSKTSQLASQDQMSQIFHRVRRQLPPLLADASKVVQVSQGEQAQVLRRRSSFIKASSTENAHALQSVSIHRWSGDTTESFCSALPARKAKRKVVSQQ